MANPAVTALSNLGIGSQGAPTTISQGLNHTEFFPGVRRNLKDTNGTRGTFWKDVNRYRENQQLVQPRIVTEPTAPEIATYLQWMQSGTPTGSDTITYPWSNGVQALNLLYVPQNGDVWQYTNVGVDTCRMSCSGQGEALEFDLQLLGMGWSNTGSLPSLTYDQSLEPFILSDLVLTFAGTTRAIRNWSLELDCGLTKNRFLNSLTLTALVKYHAGYRISFEMPSGDNPGAWDAGIAGATINAVFTNSNDGAVLSISCTTAVFPGLSPTFTKDSEGYLRMEGEANRTGSADPLVITLDET